MTSDKIALIKNDTLQNDFLQNDTLKIDTHWHSSEWQWAKWCSLEWHAAEWRSTSIGLINIPNGQAWPHHFICAWITWKPLFIYRMCCKTVQQYFSKIWFFFLRMEQTAGQSSGSNFHQNNWQKVQFNTDLLKQGHGYLYRKWWLY